MSIYVIKIHLIKENKDIKIISNSFLFNTDEIKIKDYSSDYIFTYKTEDIKLKSIVELA